MTQDYVTYQRHDFCEVGSLPGEKNGYCAFRYGGFASSIAFIRVMSDGGDL